MEKPLPVGEPSSFLVNHIISGSVPTLNWYPCFFLNSWACILKFPRQSDVKCAPGLSLSSLFLKQVTNTLATFLSHGSWQNVSGSGIPTSSLASGP